tara:strand:+ start:2504 stop:3670 length:1167 start_codon:yes stop_codon:yes gene_type:complete
MPVDARTSFDRIARRAISGSMCSPDDWLRRTDHNRASRRMVIVDSWAHVGLGHTLSATGRWLSLALATNRSIRFAFCVPRAVAAAFRARGNVMPACEEARYDQHEHVTYANLSNLRAARDDFPATVEATRLSQASPANCRELATLLDRPDQSPVILYNVPNDVTLCMGKSAVRTCISQLHPVAALVARLGAPPPCDVGLHLRTLHLDDSRCDQVRGTSTPGCAYSWRIAAPAHSRRPCAERFPESVTGCPGELRFVTSDKPALYATTRALGWRDLNETARVTWNEPPRASTSVPEASSPAAAAALAGDAAASAYDVGATVLAWFALSRCKRGVVAPVDSSFSNLAADIAMRGRRGPHSCCSALLKVEQRRTKGRVVKSRETTLVKFQG